VKTLNTISNDDGIWFMINSINHPIYGAGNAMDFFQAMKSVCAGFFGVQSESQRIKDFSSGKPVHFIMAGLICTFILVVSLILLVKMLVSV